MSTGVLGVSSGERDPKAMSEREQGHQWTVRPGMGRRPGEHGGEGVAGRQGPAALEGGSPVKVRPLTSLPCCCCLLHVFTSLPHPAFL